MLKPKSQPKLYGTKLITVLPLFIDYHQLEAGLTIQDVRQAHQSDLTNQEKYGVQYLQLWVNEKDAMVFCLIEGPNSEACVKCHLESHGNTPCNIQEVEPGLFKLFMGDGLPVDDNHMTLTLNGNADPANRIILAVEIQNERSNSISVDKLNRVSTKVNNLVVETISRFNGRFIDYKMEESLVGVFNSHINAIRCVRSMQNLFLKRSRRHIENSESNIVCRFALYNGQPLTQKGGFFDLAIRQAKRLCMIAKPSQLVVSASLKALLEMEIEASGVIIPTSVKVLNLSDEAFVNELFEITERNLNTGSFNVNNLARLIGASRTQLYRKTTSLTGKSPNGLIKDIRMRKAWNLLRSKEGNISTVALQVGYSNPSYFTKTFHEIFGCTPSEVYTKDQ